jgi:hypothetical protein
MEIWYKAIISIQALSIWLLLYKHGYFKRPFQRPPYIRDKEA